MFCILSTHNQIFNIIIRKNNDFYKNVTHDATNIMTIITTTRMQHMPML